MSDSIVLYHARDDYLDTLDPDDVPHFDEHPPLLDIVCAVIKLGYKGVAIDEIQLANGRFIHSLSANEGTPEGQIIQSLALDNAAGMQLPSIPLVIEKIKKLYNDIGGSHE